MLLKKKLFMLTDFQIVYAMFQNINGNKKSEKTDFATRVFHVFLEEKNGILIFLSKRSI